MKKLIFAASLFVVMAAAGCGGVEDVTSGLSAVPPIQDATIAGDANEYVGDVTGVDPMPDVIPTDVPLDTHELPRHSYVVVIADPHIVDPDDAEVGFARAVGEEISKMPWPIEAVFALGDICYKLPYNTFQEFVDDPYDRYDIAQEIFDAYPVPVYPLVGNHDMDNGTMIPLVDVADQLWKKHFNKDPYYSVDIGSWHFILGNNFKGPTHDIDGPKFDHDSGSMGDAQLEWMETIISDGRPTVVMTHFPGYIIQDLPKFLRAHSDKVKLELAGHSHAWMNLGDNFGVPSMVVGALNFDADSFMILELDNFDYTWRILNWDKIHWGSAYALPWDGTDEPVEAE